MRNTFKQILALFLFSPAVLLAQSDSSQVVNDDTIADLFAMDMSQLINLKVVVSSKEEQSQSETPGIVTAYSSKHINQFGYYTLNQLADITPGYASFQVFGEKVYETRGRRAGSFDNNKHLTLIDGVPFNFTRNYKSPTENELPLFFAERVEFLRGPASALYGNSAFYGVVSVQSKNLSEDFMNTEVGVATSSLNRERRLQYTTGEKTNNGRFNMSVGYYDRMASGDLIGHDTLNTDSLFRNWDDERSLFIYGNYTIESGKAKGLTIGNVLSNKTSGLGEFWWGPSSKSNELTWQSIMPFVKYTRTKKKWTYNGYTKFQTSEERGKYAVLGNPDTNSLGQFENTSHRLFSEYTSQSINAEVMSELVGQINDNLKLRVGINYDLRREVGDPYSHVAFINSADSINPSFEDLQEWEPSMNFHTFSSFLQVEKNINFLAGLSIIGGLREDFGYTVANQYLQLSPRLGLVQKFTDKWSYKLLYGSALRAPGIKEVGLNQETKEDLSLRGQNNGFIGSISAETFQNIESSIVYSTNNITTSFTGYRNRTHNSLNGVSRNNVNFFENSNNTNTVYGFEFDLNAFITKNVYVMVSHAASFVEDSIAPESNYTQTARTNAAISYHFNGKLGPTVSMVNRFIYGYRYFDIDQYSTTPSFNLMDMNILFPLSKHIRLDLQVRNVLGTDYSQPGINGSRYDIPGKNRSFLLSLYSNF